MAHPFRGSMALHTVRLVEIIATAEPVPVLPHNSRTRL